jgi:ketosteroid isomerase-like protein
VGAILGAGLLAIGVGVLKAVDQAWDKFELSADEFIEQGDTVVVLGHTDVAKGERSARVPVVHVSRYRGEQVCRLQILTDTLDTARILNGRAGVVGRRALAATGATLGS